MSEKRKKMEKKTKAEIMRDYRSKNCDMIQFPVPKGEREKIKAYATSVGLSQNEFIRRAIRQAMETGFPNGYSSD